MMHRIAMAALVVLAQDIACACTCDAAYLGLTAKLHTTVIVGGNPRAGYRIYAVFDNPGDYVTSVSGSNANGPMLLESLNSNGSAPGGNFFDSSSGTPGSMSTNASAAAIGVFMGSDPLFISGNSFFDDNIVWFTLGPQEQGRAGGPNGVPLEFNGKPGLGVMVMQLAVPAGDHVAGTMNIGVSLAGSGGQTIAGETFTSVIPQPGDVTGNGKVDVDDLLAVINAWGNCPAPPAECAADIAPSGGNGIVDVDDLLMVVNNWN